MVQPCKRVKGEKGRTRIYHITTCQIARCSNDSIAVVLLLVFGNATAVFVFMSQLWYLLSAVCLSSRLKLSMLLLLLLLQLLLLMLATMPFHELLCDVCSLLVAAYDALMLMLLRLGVAMFSK